MTLNIYLISSAGINLFTYKDGMDKELEDAEDLLFSCAVGGFINVLKTITKSNLKVRCIDLGALKLHFKYGSKVWGFLISDRENMKIREKLERFVYNFEDQYQQKLEAWNGNRTQFSGARELVKQIFISSCTDA